MMVAFGHTTLPVRLKIHPLLQKYVPLDLSFYMKIAIYGSELSSESSNDCNHTSKDVRNYNHQNQITHAPQATHQATATPSTQLSLSKRLAAIESHFKVEKFSEVPD